MRSPSGRGKFTGTGTRSRIETAPFECAKLAPNGICHDTLFSQFYSKLCLGINVTADERLVIEEEQNQ
jgi:hypothetical protein